MNSVFARSCRGGQDISPELHWSSFQAQTKASRSPASTRTPRPVAASALGARGVAAEHHRVAARSRRRQGSPRAGLAYLRAHVGNLELLPAIVTHWERTAKPITGHSKSSSSARLFSSNQPLAPILQSAKSVAGKRRR
jgi:hypothetical protein